MEHFDLKKTLDSLWSSTVRNMNFNLCSHSISLDVDVINNGNTVKYSIVFEDVSSFYFSDELVQDFGDSWDYIELTSIHFYRDGIGKIIIESKKKWASEYKSSANFVLEFWSSVLLIQAKFININGNKIEVVN
ncbi:hypothetical protein JQN58_20735 [Aneurinibacillus sp. BA2021]|nr:hypothetical protein [Aneurinibacillus sp. BA2021]